MLFYWYTEYDQIRLWQYMLFQLSWMWLFIFRTMLVKTTNNDGGHSEDDDDDDEVATVPTIFGSW